jgi:hypothetical protein
MKDNLYFAKTNSVDETINALNEIKAKNYDRWTISTYKDKIGPVFDIDIIRKQEQRRKGNDWLYVLSITFTYLGKKYTSRYSDIYLSRLLKTKYDIILTRLKQSYYGRTE